MHLPQKCQSQRKHENNDSEHKILEQKLLVETMKWR